MVKEEGDSSQTNQPYDQFIAKSDKRHIRELLDQVRFSLGKISQWDLIALCVVALKNTTRDRDSWKKSFIRVNLHPQHRVSIMEWLKKIEQTVAVGDRFFTAHNSSLFDAMPAFWQKLTVEARHKCMAVIDECHNTVEPGSKVWSKDNVRKLREFCDFDHIPMLRACYLAAKNDGSVLIGSYLESSAATQDTTTQKSIESHAIFTKWDAKPLLQEYVKDRNCPVQQGKFFNHVTNLAAREHVQNSSKPLAPSAHLDVVISEDQKQLLNPSWKNVVMGQIINESIGKCAIKRLAKRRINVMHGNINSYAKVCCCV